MLSDKEFMRYHRQISLPDIGDGGQQKLKDAHVLMIGCGGLGSSAGLYLASAGVGRLVVADGDHVDSSNLQRQVVYRDNDQGSNKAQAMSEHLTQLNPLIQVRAITKPLSGIQLSMEIQLADLVLDCTDNLETRHLVNKACYESKTPLISGSAIGWQGQLACFDYGDNQPCYRCLYAFEHMAPGTKCSDAGIVGPVVGIVGTFQALQAIKFLAKDRTSEFNQLYLFDGQYLDWRTLAISKNDDCPVCGSC